MTEAATHDAVTLSSGEARAVVALMGAEPTRWTVGGRELLWNGDPAHWNRSAPFLFPLVGASREGRVRVGGRDHPMPQHGFARDRAFTVVERGEASVRLRLDSDDETLARYPWPFRLDVTVALSETALDLAFAVSNRGGEPMPYGLGFHPAFPWPFDASDLAGHAVAFEAPERAVVPLLTPDGLLRRETRSLPLDGARLPLAPELFAPGAMAFLDARSRSMRFVSPSGSAIALSGEGWPHLALWTKPSAPFLSMELWTAHADWEDFDGELTERPSLIALEPGETREHRLRMEWEAG